MNTSEKKRKEEIKDYENSFDQYDSLSYKEEYYKGKEMKNSEMMKWIYAGVGIMGFLSILQSFF